MVDQLHWDIIRGCSAHAYGLGLPSEPMTFACALEAGRLVQAALWDNKIVLTQIPGVTLGRWEEGVVGFSVSDVEVRLVVVQGGARASNREVYSEMLLGWLLEEQKVPPAFQEAAYALKLVAEARGWIRYAGGPTATSVEDYTHFTPIAFVYFLAALARETARDDPPSAPDLAFQLLLMMRDFCWASFEIVVDLCVGVPGAVTAVSDAAAVSDDRGKWARMRRDDPPPPDASSSSAAAPVCSFTISTKQNAEATAARLTLNDVNLTANVTPSFLAQFTADLHFIVGHVPESSPLRPDTPLCAPDAVQKFGRVLESTQAKLDLWRHKSRRGLAAVATRTARLAGLFDDTGPGRCARCKIALASGRDQVLCEPCWAFYPAWIHPTAGSRVRERLHQPGEEGLHQSGEGLDQSGEGLDQPGEELPRGGAASARRGAASDRRGVGGRGRYLHPGPESS